jgi:hypothetical protein
MVKAHLPALAFALALAGCDHVPADAVESCQQDVQILPTQTDILVVVDDSGSMEDEQQNLRDNLETFVTALASSPVANDVQIGVTTTDVVDFDGTTAAYGSGPSRSVPYPRGALVAVAPGALTDSSLIGDLVYDSSTGFGGTRILVQGSSTLVADFETNVLLGVRGSGKEEPLHAVRLALADRMDDGTNTGFLRSGARLAVIILTDEDDCTELTTPIVATTNDLCHSTTVKAKGLESVDDFVSFLDGEIQGELRTPLVAVIAGFDPSTLAPSGCTNPSTGQSSYDDPTRLGALVTALGSDRAFKGSICDTSFGSSLEQIAELLVPQTVSLEGAPADGRMLVVSLVKPGGTVVGCPVAISGAADTSSAGVVYQPPQEGRQATLTFQGVCRLESRDQVDISVVCAG